MLQASANGTIRVPIKKESRAAQISLSSKAYGQATAAETDVTVSDGSTKKLRVREPLESDLNLAYIGKLYIGTSDPPQMVRVNFDTGSANPWIVAK